MFKMAICLFIAPGQGQKAHLARSFIKYKSFVTMLTCCKFLPLNNFLTVFMLTPVHRSMHFCLL